VAFRAANSELYEEVQQDQQGAQEGQNHATGGGAAWDAAKRSSETGRHSFEAGVGTRAVKRADYGIARKTAADSAGLVLDPNRNFFASAPYQSGAKREE
jgi:hypothetical protein